MLPIVTEELMLKKTSPQSLAYVHGTRVVLFQHKAQPTYTY
jgi:hypothetical protein